MDAMSKKVIYQENKLNFLQLEPFLTDVTSGALCLILTNPL